ncbi:hypothetical protein B4589_012115 [Halolamina sp. CBA1230]|uniref:hypothetical protein n=1 Tax=Halolamina sp. CBA1230 TaxID=1853690 RepID=UPI0009A223C3|nr:hypothetical protein [Halolamina sp. CBA1230]QKY21082.1 hypothetical protein B4589_012115 [Halolamina sp. CBA1230]
MLKRAFAFVAGVAGAALPEKAIEIGNRSMLVGYENPEELEPEEWYVDAVRYVAVLLAVAALIAPFLPTPGSEKDEDDDAAEPGPVVDVIESSDD